MGPLDSESIDQDMRNGPVKQSLPALVDYFIHSSLRTDHDRYYRVRILIAAMLAFAAVPLMAFLVVLTTQLQSQSILNGGAICLPLSAFFMVLLFLSRHKGMFLFCSVSSVLALLIAIVAGISVSGGPVVSPVVQLIAIPPLTAYFFGGLRWGRYAVIVSFLALIVLYALHLVGSVFIQTLVDDEQMKTAWLIVGFLNLFVISTMAFIYEFTSVALKKERDTEHEKYMLLAKIDPLTGLANRRHFDALLAERMLMYGAQDPPSRFALGYLDLDGFKPVNDQYGHSVGDEVLRAISDRLCAVLREADLVGRHGGDEFMLLLDSICDASGLESMAQRLLDAIARPIDTSAGNVSVSGSLGFAIYPFDASEIEELKRHSDTAMYAAKRQRGSWRLYQQGM